MANTMNVVDVYTIVNAMAAEMYGQQSTVQAIDTSSFCTVGEAMLRTGYEKTLNCLSEVLGRTIVSVRPYKGKLAIITRVNQEYGIYTRKISYFTGSNEAYSADNTTTASPITDGQAVDMYTIKKVYPLEINFVGQKVLEKSFTRFEYQLKKAFQSEAEFSAFVSGIFMEVANEIEVNKEAENRLTMLNYIGALKDSDNTKMAIDLVAAFNAEYGTSYTGAQLRTTYLKQFLAFFVETFKLVSDRMTEISEVYHCTPAKTDDAGNTLHLNRHTPKADQRVLLYNPLFVKAEAEVLPEIFNDQYLKLEQGERVNYWQNINEPEKVDVTPNIFDSATGQSKTAEEAVQIPYVVGVLFDRDAVGTNYQFESAMTTPINAKGLYMNTFYHWAKNYWNDMTENGVLFYMAS